MSIQLRLEDFLYFLLGSLILEYLKILNVILYFS